MGKTKLSPDEIRELRAAYEEWNPHDPDAPTADELAARFGITKQTMYNLKKRWEQADRDKQSASDESSEAHLSKVVLMLTEQLTEARAEIDRLRSRLNGR